MSKLVVLIDDDQDDLDLLTEALRNLDELIRPVKFQNSQEALKFLKEEVLVVPNYIFIDVNMPGVRGDKILRELRKISLYDPVIIIILSTAMSLPDSERYKGDGANFTFKKPVVFDEYDNILRTIFHPLSTYK